MFDEPVFCCYKILELLYFFITSQNNASFIHFIFEEIINEHSDALWFGIYWLLVCTQEKKTKYDEIKQVSIHFKCATEINSIIQ